ncbi:MAG: response regulator, partial [Saprospiraceae bacterium]|nr:response regulator [Saprospiraceae bacterium]
MKVLIIEDEPLHADRFEMLVQQMGYEVVGNCDNAFDALDCFHRNQPDLLLLDIHLRGEIDGIQLAERVNQIRPVPHVFVTSMQDDYTFERAKQTQPMAFILKPFDALQLQRAIELAIVRLSADSSESHFEQNDLVLTDCFYVKVREKLQKVNISEILYIESDTRYSMIYTANGKKYA